ncbi:Pkinase-domain-containing protein [Phlegmacium glaucopus]|nr:Pkinase-domain-containing protein [Phlegmacium glaucopus]
MHPSDQLPVSVATTRKYRPLPPRPSQQQNRDAAYSGNQYRNRTSGISSLSPNLARRSNGSFTRTAPKRDDSVGAQALLENIVDHTPPNGAIANQTISQGQWKRLGFIGEGSYGQVYRALDATTGDIFAVKQVASKIKRRSTLVQALQDERETLKELEHPNIVHYLGFEEVQGVLNIFLEYVPGGTIRSCLNTHGKFKEEVTKCFANQILQGLSYLHSKSILHRDLKSENILVEPRGSCKISDFGISKKALERNRGRLYTNMKGTLAFMAPEMIDNKKEGYDSKIDIWSVGCIVFEMWTSKTPWSGREDMQIIMKLYREKLPPPLPDDVSLSTTAESFRQECFHVIPEKRPPAVKLLQHAYLKLPPQWAFPGIDKMGQASDTCDSKSIASPQPSYRTKNPSTNQFILTSGQ